jgi:predicted small lipoprotein YifL
MRLAGVADMKTGLIAVFLLVLTGLVAGCGQKGALYRDVPAETQAEQDAVSADQTASDDER